MKDKHMFAGVNTPRGFFSRFDQIMPESADGRKIFIKGGPGMGKSTLMKKIMQRAKEEGLWCEVFHCASDPSSIDGVHIPALKTAVLDATAPHNCDPMYPCIGGELLDVSRFVQKDKLAEVSEEIAFQTARKKRNFAKGYQYLAAALPLLRQTEAEHGENADIRSIYARAETLGERVLGVSTKAGKGEKRSLFISAITSEGFVNFADTVFRGTTCIALSGNFGGALFIRRFLEIATMRGFSPMVFYCPMRPDEKPEHLYIPELNFSLTTQGYYVKAEAKEVIDLSAYAPSSTQISECFLQAGALMQRAVDAFAEAKTAHAFVEACYIPAMDFAALEKKEEELINSIF